MATPTEEPTSTLSQFLNDTLPALSLDTETYIPYITGCLENFQDNDEDTEEDDFDEIIQLLQASSESHSDDEQVWINLKHDILQRHRASVNMEREKKMMDQRDLQYLQRI